MRLIIAAMIKDIKNNLNGKESKLEMGRKNV